MQIRRRTRRPAVLGLLTLAGMMLGATLARATLCAVDNVPAATLLVPYFEVNLLNPTRSTTLISITNARSQATLAHVVLWTDYAVPTLAFDVYLTGFDVQTIDLRDVFAGQLPATADLADDFGDLLSPKGPLSDDSSFPGCAGLLPPPPIPPATLDTLRRAHQGLPSSGPGGSLCAGHAFDDLVARGYVTIDVATQCSTLVPGDPGYFGAGGVAGYDNVLLGDFFYVDGSAPAAQGFNMVRIEADPSRFAGSSRTFYRTLVHGSGADGREPLPTLWAQRYFNGGPFAGATELIVWRDTETPGAPVPCNSQPAWFPMPQGVLVAYDEQEHPAFLTGGCGEAIICDNPPPPPRPFPLAANRTPMNTFGVPVPFAFGWLFLNLQTAVSADTASQAWVVGISSAGGGYRIGVDATPLDNGCAPNPFVP
jgi:hypothetical protein